MENKTVTPEIGLDVALKNTKQAQTSIANTQKKKLCYFQSHIQRRYWNFRNCYNCFIYFRKLFRLLTKRQNVKIRHRTPNTVANAETNI